MKKLLLSFIGLIGILEKCAFVSGAAVALDTDCSSISTLSDCTGTTITSPTYCIGTNILVKTTENESDCKMTLGAGFHVFEVATTTKELDLSSTTETVSAAAKLAMYECVADESTGDITCTKKPGHVKIGSKYYTIDGTNDSAEITSSGYYLLTNGDLLSCSGSPLTCSVATKSYGYFKNSKNIYSCTTSTCTEENPTEQACDAAGLSKLIINDNKIKLCVLGTTSDPMPEFKATTTKYMISINAANAFSSTDVANNFVLISITDTAITVSDSSGYYIASATTNELVSVKDTEGTLYTCNSNKCTATASDDLTATDIGYYKNGDTNDLYIKCYEKETANTFKCETIESPANTVTCGSGTIGQLVKDGKFCLDGSKEATFETTAGNPKMYQLSYSATSFFASTVTEEGTYGIVEVTTNTIKLKSTAFTDGACVSTSTLEVTDKATCTEGTEENCKGFTASSNFCYYDCVNSTGKNCLEGRYYLFDKTNTDTLVTSTDDGTLVKCKASGACDSVTDVVGYFVNSDFGTASTNSHIKCAEASGAIKCKLYAPTDACSATLIGQLSTDTPDSFCFGGTSVIKKGFATSADDENARYLLEYNEDSPFSSVIPNGKSGIIKIGKYDVTLDTDYQSDYGVCTNDSTLVVTERTSATDCASGSTKTGFCSGGICFNPCQVSATTRDTTTCLNDNYYLVKDAASSIPIMDETTSGSLYLCETGGTGACTAVTTVGYYLNSKEEAFICETANNALGCKRMSLQTGCLVATIGQPIIDTDTKAYFCLNYASDTATKSDEMANAALNKNYLLGYKEGNIFGITQDHYGLITVTKSSVTLVNKSGYCLGDKTALTSLAASSAEGKLYNCVNGICEAVPDTDTTMAVGYYKNIGSLAPGDVDYIEFTTATSGSTITKTFKALSITGAANAACAAASIGKIILDSGTSKYTMCLTDSIGIELGVEANNGQYFVDVTKATVFGAKTTADTHAIIDISGDNVTLHANETGVERYRYGSATTQKLIDFTATADQTTYCPANADLTSTTIEFSLIDEEEGDTTNYYKKLAYPQAAP